MTLRPVEIAKFNDLDETWASVGGLATRCVFMGGQNDPDAPVGVAIKADRDVGDMIAGRRSFNTTTMTVMLTGTLMHDGKWLKPGDIYMSPPNDVNGDLVFGPEGGVIFIMFEKRSGIIPTFEDPRDQAKFDEMLRADVEEVASGRVEKSVSILPPRDEYTMDRAIVYRTLEAVAQYREESGQQGW